MSQELVGRCGAIVGSSEYFYKINQGAIFAPFMPSIGGYQYSAAVQQMCSICAGVIDEIYADLQNAKAVLPQLPDTRKENLMALVGNLDEAAGCLPPAFTNASGCRDLILHSEPSEPAGILGIWGDDIGSDGYMQSKCSPIFRSILSNPLSNISQQIHQDISEIGGQIAADIEMGLHLHHYVRDDFGNNLRGAVTELEHCGCGGLSFCASKIQSLCWYREISSSNVLALQKALNKIPGSDTLTEDGVYGEKTSGAYSFLINELLHGSFPILTYVDPLQSAHTGIHVKPKITKQGQTYSQMFANGTKWPIFRADMHPIGGGNPVPHVNVKAVNGAPTWQQSMADSLDHQEIPEEVYNFLKNFDDSAKIIKIGGKILLVSGAIADAIVLGDAIHTDLNDADQKLGKLTAQTGASIIGSWSGGAIGAKAGAYAGAMIGSAIFPGPGTLVGGAVGSLVLGIAGSIGGSVFGEWIVDISNIWE